MNTPVSCEEAVRRYPQQVKVILDKLRQGNSKNRTSEAQDLTWRFDWCVSGRAMNFVQVLDEARNRQTNPQPEPTVEERLKDFAGRCRVRLAATVGHWQGFSEWIPVPDEILALQRAAYEKDARERERLAALTPEERQQETKALLNQLRGTPGVVAIQVR